LLLALAGAAAANAAPHKALAGESACWFENGVVVVPAEVLGVSGDYILDTGAARTVLAETQAQGAGYAETALTGEVALAGMRIPDRPVVVQSIDVRTGLFATPIAGVIGADVLKAYVLDLSFAPCRLALRPACQAPAFRAAAVLPLSWIAGVPAVTASVSDGPHVVTGAFALATGSDTPLRISDAVAAAPGAAKPRELYPYGVLRPRLRALSLAGQIAEHLPAGLLKTEDPALLGEFGAPLLWAWRVRFDFPAGRLLLAPK
ncbi:MAG: hypothetical protein JWP86_471, partial [Phenylobacterium sp.]|nr:hypothetical protein [Phenylobacterium sp.]